MYELFEHFNENIKRIFYETTRLSFCAVGSFRKTKHNKLKHKIMIHYARTYGSIHHPNNLIEAWKYPTAPVLDSFGVTIPEQNKTFGLEEFNFNPLYLNEKIAYIPCYGTVRFYPRLFIEELRLIYRVKDTCYCHYATLFNIVSFNNNEIVNLRQIINPELNQIYFSQESQGFFGADFTTFQRKIQEMYDSNSIADNQNDNSFLVNVKYERIEILDKPIYCKLNSHYAAQWKINVEYPCICK